jgi:outer membrane protein assembly factor BamB
MPLRTPSAGFVFPYEATQPLLKKDILYVADQQGRVLAIQRNLGFVLWETKVPGGVLGALAYGRSKLFVGNRNGDLLALNARDGSESWRFTSASKWLAVPAVSKMYNQVFARTSAGTLYALSETKGDLLWSYPNASDKKMTIWGSGGPTLFRDSEIFQGFDDGTLVALKAENGQLIWQKKLGLNRRFEDVDMSPYVDEERVIAASYDGQLYCLDRLTGNVRWVFPVGSKSGFLVQGERLFFGGVNNHFYALDLNGKTIWSTPYEGGVALTPLLLKGVLIFPTSSDPTYLLDPKDGKVLGQLSLGAGTLAPFVGSEEDGWFYALSNYGNLYSFELRQ